MTTPYIGQDAYNKFDDLDSFSYNCIQYLMDNSELIWRLLKYKTPSAWDSTICPNLSKQEKGAEQESGSLGVALS